MKFFLTERFSTFPCFASLIILVCFSTTAFAQSITLTSPTTELNLQEGDDYSSTIFKNPCDMDQRRDLGWDIGYNQASISAVNGIWKGTTTSASFVYPILGNILGSLNSEGPEDDMETPKLGWNRPVDTSKYTFASYAMKTTQIAGHNFSWRGKVKESDTSNSFYSTYTARYDNFEESQWGIGYARVGNSSNWKNLVTEFNINFGFGGMTTEIDWFRLVDPNSAPNLNISWNFSKSASGITNIYLDNNNSGYDGVYLHRQSSTSTRNFSFPSAALPPGTYYIYATFQPNSGAMTYSNYSARITINEAPRLIFTAPNQISGQEYSTTEAKNSWNMSQSSDVANLPGSKWPYVWRQWSNHRFENGRLYATADVPITGNAHTDAQVHLNVPAHKPIDTNKYRYLTYRLSVGDNDKQFDPAPDAGWVARVVSWNENVLVDGMVTQDQILFEGLKSYTIDLWDTTKILENGVPWQANSLIRNLRIDPLESVRPTNFSITNVKLNAENHTSSDKKFTIKWKIVDGDNASTNMDLFYDTNNKGFDGTLINSFSNLSPGNHSYSWDASDLSAGTSVYVYFVVNDGVNTKKYYSPVPIIIGSYSPPYVHSKAPLDYNGDLVSDIAAYERAGQKTGQFRTRFNVHTVGDMPLGDKNSWPLFGDFDGDKKTDYTVFNIVPDGNLNPYLWRIKNSTNGALQNIWWGVQGDQFAIGDWDGNGADSVGIVRTWGVWNFWLIRNDNGTAGYWFWGLTSDRPITADFDGDGKTDFGIWRPSDGSWWIISSTGGLLKKVWGSKGDVPLAGDFDADGKADFVVWRPSNGTWYILSSSTGETEVLPWGLNGDVPFVSDFNGDGLMDLSVFRPSTNHYYFNHRNGVAQSVGWGVPGYHFIPRNDYFHR